MHFDDLPLHPFLDSLLHPMVFTFSSNAVKISIDKGTMCTLNSPNEVELTKLLGKKIRFNGYKSNYNVLFTITK